ncbi:MAG: hypothetical protein ACO1RT_14045 [Planctomycetaceae bacterium]
MNRCFQLALLSVFLFVLGCGGSGTNTSVVENADEQALAEYNEMIKADEEARKSWDKK